MKKPRKSPWKPKPWLYIMPEVRYDTHSRGTPFEGDHDLFTAAIGAIVEVIRRMTDIMLEEPGVAHSVAFPGLSVNGFVNAPNVGIAFVALRDFDTNTATQHLTPGFLMLDHYLTTGSMLPHQRALDMAAGAPA